MTDTRIGPVTVHETLVALIDDLLADIARERDGRRGYAEAIDLLLDLRIIALDHAVAAGLAEWRSAGAPLRVRDGRG